MRLHEGETSKGAIDQALDACVETNIGRVITRIQEAGYEAHRQGPMYKDQFDRLIKGSNHVMKSLDRSRIREAVKGCDKNAFKPDVKRITGVDERIL